MVAGSSTSDATRARLLEAAGEVFAEVGFREATIRDICRSAGANIAAVNYHFRSKEQLYATALEHAHRCAIQTHAPTMGLTPDASAQQRLRGFVRAFLARLFDEGRPAWFGRLMAREMIEPTAALDQLVDSTIRAQSQILRSIIADIIPRATDEQLRHCMNSVVGQCLFYHHCRPVIERLFPQQHFEAEDVARLADHITNFSYAALQSLARAVPRKRSRRSVAARGKDRS